MIQAYTYGMETKMGWWRTTTGLDFVQEKQFQSVEEVGQFLASFQVKS